MNQLSTAQTIMVWALPVLFAITVHEVAHGWVAFKLGDPTAKAMGRLTLNPVKHIDPVGTLLVPLVSFMLGGFIFGWAKPVPVNPSFFRHFRRDSALVAAAGPLSNLLMALVWALMTKLAIVLHGSSPLDTTYLIYAGAAGIAINCILMVLNLVPIPPLDGSRVVSGFLSYRWSVVYNRLEPYGFLILILLLTMGILGNLIMPLVDYCQYAILSLFSLPSIY